MKLLNEQRSLLQIAEIFVLKYQSREYNAYINQLIPCSSSVGANCRGSQRAKSTADFIYKLKIVEEEADKRIYWLEILEDILPNDINEIQKMKVEGKQLLGVIVASINTTKRNQKNKS